MATSLALRDSGGVDTHAACRTKGEMHMRFMMMVKGGADYEAGVAPRPDLMRAVGRLTKEMIDAGVLVDSGGLLPSSAGARVRVSKGQLLVTDGPFPETKELIGGYAVVYAGSKREAIELGRRFMGLHADILGPSYEGEVEIRQFVDSQPTAEGD